MKQRRGEVPRGGGDGLPGAPSSGRLAGMGMRLSGEGSVERGTGGLGSNRFNFQGVPPFVTANRFLLFCSGFFLGLSSCSDDKLKAGTYEFENSKHKCELVLLGNKTFQQTVWIKKTGTPIKLAGNWEQDGRDVTFSPFYYSIDIDTGKEIDNPIRYEGSSGDGRGNVIIFDESAHYWFNLK
ncbi:hypothetical protein [Luteolibacter soli]|uniref:Lipoprotein n=1 Tax=Luteolibacter soli TaxID=3135280 RepID=A0ABU9AQF0_9BACT